MVQFISLGSPHGGCNLGALCRHYKQLSLPFDWMYTKHEFVVDNLLSEFSNFNIFDENIKSNTYINKEKTALLGHITLNETVDDSKNKYKRRCNRFLNILKTCIANSEYVIFLRQTSIKNLSGSSAGPLASNIIDNYSVKESIEDWETFFDKFSKLYPELKYKFICFSTNRKTSSINPNIIISDINTFIPDWADIINPLNDLISKTNI